MHRFSNSVATLACLFLLASTGFSQTITGAITGTVTDPSGAAIPQVKVTATNTATNVATASETNQSGLYNLLFLPVGQYTVTAEAQGFKKSILGPFALELNQTARVDVALQVGQLTESVEVTGVAPILQTESTQTGDTIDAQKLTSIPLNGRNPVSEILFLTGTIQTNPASVNSADRLGARMFVNGNREQTNNFMLDGVDVNDSMDNRIGYLPSVDALEEMKVLTGNAPAEFGNSAGAIVNMTIKSGTNQFHGDVFEFLRNDKLDANGFFGNRSGAKKRAFRQNTFGGTVGGPIVRNKAFFFADYEGTRRRDSGTALATVAPAAFRTGNLSLLPQPIKDPTLGLPCTAADRRGCFAGNIIPASRIVNPVAQALFANPTLYPAANTTGVGTLGYTNNYTGTSSNRLNNDQGDFKLDYRAGDRDSFSFRYSQGAYLSGAGSVLLPTSVGGVQEAPTKGASFTWTRTLSATLVNEARLGFTRTVIMDDFADLAGQLGPSGNNKLGIPGSQPTAGASSVGLGEGLSGIGTPGVLSDGKDNKYQFSENLTWQRGRHLLKMGANGVRYQQNRFYSGNNGGLGSFGYSGDYTGSAYADFLLDLLRSKGRGQADRRRWGQRHWRSGIFFQDDFKVRPNLTVNLGLRWEYEQPLYEVNDLQANIDKVTGQINLAGKNGNSRALYNSYYKQFMPRVGIAWTPGMFNNRLAVRAGYGITSFLEGTGVNLRLPLNPPFFFESNVNYGDSNPGTIRTGFSDITTFTGQLAGNIRIWDPNLRPQFTQQMNLSMEYQLSNSMSLNTGYVGQRAKHTIVARDTNQPLPGVGPVLSWAPIQQRRPLYPFVPGVTTTATTESTGTMNYDSLQVSLRKRFSAGLDFQASYTLSKTINDALGFFGAGATDSEGAYWQNAYDRKSNRGPAA
ncbi:MAG: TonB-dependent receptor, partial [Acidobacteriota bacterium]|nr:TonB-dependent receptor [Acidobacteriota bacterium]